LTEERELREYMPGDVVRMELNVENDGANLDNAFARFVHEGDPQFHVILTQDLAAMTREAAAGSAETRLAVEATIPGSIPAGKYALEQVHVRCASGRIYRFTREMLPNPGARFRVVDEPTGEMVLKGATLMD
jgi:hypothetical protein